MRNILAVLTLGMISPKLPIIKLTILAIIVFVFYTNPVQAEHHPASYDAPISLEADLEEAAISLEEELKKARDQRQKWYLRQPRMSFDCEEFLHDDLAALACNIYWEGRNQDSEGMLAIAAVTMWRVRDPAYPDTIADVVWEKNWSRRFGKNIAMFSWTLDGKRDHPFKNEQKQWDEAWLIARNFAISSEQKDRMCPHINETLDKWNAQEEQGEIVKREPIKCEAYEILLEAKYYMMSILDQTDGATMYHADYVKPWWVKSYTFTKQIGNHLFYAKKKKEKS
jgi:spore germination cell wall hydrolase CwlJ-like protein